jgi:hypothetical protein
MSEYVQTWRKKIRIKILSDIAQRELRSGQETYQVYEKLDKEMKDRWNLVLCTRKQYLEEINKVLNKFSANKITLINTKHVQTYSQKTRQI